MACISQVRDGLAQFTGNSEGVFCAMCDYGTLERGGVWVSEHGTMALCPHCILRGAAPLAAILRDGLNDGNLPQEAVSHSVAALLQHVGLTLDAAKLPPPICSIIPEARRQLDRMMVAGCSRSVGNWVLGVIGRLESENSILRDRIIEHERIARLAVCEAV